MPKKQPQSSEPFSIRLPVQLYNKLFAVIAATGCEITRTDLIIRALETYIALLSCNPSMLEGYDKAKDVSVTRSNTL